ncbi:MAG: transketolase [Euzebyales bacterium]|nr:transketolase [Euzebyales bacterium]MBA3620955.1 transketolase [Euzebyales bacterium]
MTADLDLLAVNTIRTLSMDAVQKANSGHPGTPMALAPLGYVLFTRHMAHNPADPEWPDRDRFVLSAGHASMLLYSLLHLTGYDLPLDEIRRFRQLGSATPGHPEHFETPGVDITTGPLGQGLGSAVGMALAERLLAARFNRPGHEIVDHRTWVIASDGDMMEGVGSEASSLAAHLGLDRLVVVYDDNRITLSGRASESLSEDVVARYEAYGWRTLAVSDVNDLDEIDGALKQAAAGDGRPTLIRYPSTIGYGAPNLADTYKAHGSPLGDEEIAAAKRAYGWAYEEPLTVPEEARRHAEQIERGARAQEQWQARFDAYRHAHPDLAAEFERVMASQLPDGWDAELPDFSPGDELATRKASGTVINAIAPRMPELVGGSADLSTSNNTDIEDAGLIAAHDFAGRNLNWGVREHAMAAAMNGMALHGGLRVFGGTFLTFTDYLRPSLRLACLMGLPTVYVMTHDSIGLGEDGPTHQPVEHLASLRAMPGLHVLRPADATETVGAWRHAITRSDGPTLLALSRQDLPVLDGTSAGALTNGAYILDGPGEEEAEEDIHVVLVATGSEVSLAVAAAEVLADRDVQARVVSMPCWELFAEADPDYQDAVLPDDVPVLAVEAASSFGWSRWADDCVAIDSFGASAPAGDLFAEFGFTPEAVAEAAMDLLEEE